VIALCTLRRIASDEARPVGHRYRRPELGLVKDRREGDDEIMVLTRDALAFFVLLRFLDARVVEAVHRLNGGAHGICFRVMSWAVDRR